MDGVETERMVLRAPRLNDAQPIFERYASDPEVTRYLGWPRHTSVADTRAFVKFSTTQWGKWNAGPMVAISRDAGTLLGSTGLTFEAPDVAQTVFARDAWGQGYATEVLRAMIELATQRGVKRLYALCHPEHRASWHVLEKCDFVREQVLPRHAVFPNLSPDPADVVSYARAL
jgi:RimJ/RimL family protein N-acetyltransferase